MNIKIKVKTMDGGDHELEVDSEVIFDINKITSNKNAFLASVKQSPVYYRRKNEYTP
jgi:hypothetical protein